MGHRVSPNVMYKLGWEIENIVRNHNYAITQCRHNVSSWLLFLNSDFFIVFPMFPHLLDAAYCFNRTRRYLIMKDELWPFECTFPGIFEYIYQCMSRRCRAYIFRNSCNFERTLTKFLCHIFLFIINLLWNNTFMLHSVLWPYFFSVYLSR